MVFRFKRKPCKLNFMKIDSYSPLKSFAALGFLGVSVERYSKSSFSSLRKLVVGVLEVNETFEELYISNNQNVIPSKMSLIADVLKCNGVFVLISELMYVVKQNLSNFIL
jgi:hypothetical protein